MTTPSFAFVDLAGYTALTDAHGDEAAASHAARFSKLARHALLPAVELVKTIGDGVMLASPDPLACLQRVEDLMAACLREPDFPIARAGLHQGTAVLRDGDWFGSGVNVAARVTALAAGMQLLVTEPIGRVARDAGRAVSEFGEVTLRGVTTPVRLYSVDVGDVGAHTSVDPVCRMRGDIRTAAGTLHYDDQDWWFCSLACANRFSVEPTAYTQ